MAISKSFVQRTLAKHLPKLGDGRIDSTYKITTDSTYNTETGVVTEQGTTIFNCKALFYSFKVSKYQADFIEIENQSETMKIKKVMIECSVFPEGFLPKKDDMIFNSYENITYAVVGMTVDPYRGVFVLIIKEFELGIVALLFGPDGNILLGPDDQEMEVV